MGFFEAIFLIIRPTRLGTVSVRPFDLITVSVVDYGILAHRVEVEEGRLEIIVGGCKTKFMSAECNDSAFYVFLTAVNTNKMNRLLRSE